LGPRATLTIEKRLVGIQRSDSRLKKTGWDPEIWYSLEGVRLGRRNSVTIEIRLVGTQILNAEERRKIYFLCQEPNSDF